MKVKQAELPFDRPGELPLFGSPAQVDAPTLPTAPQPSSSAPGPERTRYTVRGGLTTLGRVKPTRDPLDMPWVRELADHGPDNRRPNKNGVYARTHPDAEVIGWSDTRRRPRAAASITLLALAPGRWLESVDYGFKCGDMLGGSGPLMAVGCCPHPSRAAALDHAATEISRAAKPYAKRDPDPNADQYSSMTRNQIEVARDLYAWAEQLRKGGGSLGI